MITLANTLKTADILIDLPGASIAAATHDLMNLLRHDKRIGDWAAFVDSVGSSNICIEGEEGTNFCIPHSRSRAVRQMVIATGRCAAGIPVASSTLPDRCHYVFLIGIPSAMDAEYLRLIGSLARIFHNANAVAALNAATSATEFHSALSAAEKSF